MVDWNCIFCDISQGKIPATKIFEDDTVFAILDIAPKAPEHILVIPHAHIEDLVFSSVREINAVMHCMKKAPQIANNRGLSHSGYRLVVNQGIDSGQEVPHFHLHILGGRKLQTMG